MYYFSGIIIFVIYQWNIFEFVYSWKLQGRQLTGWRPLESIGKQIDESSTDRLLAILYFVYLCANGTTLHGDTESIKKDPNCNTSGLSVSKIKYRSSFIVLVSLRLWVHPLLVVRLQAFPLRQ
ncbi:MAG: hypothetical protein LBC20_05145, partial [Planctomycetaceae bacterium]|nr:hypothetical protein [Planctomycetaceae bacterium]